MSDRVSERQRPAGRSLKWGSEATPVGLRNCSDEAALW